MKIKRLLYVMLAGCLLIGVFGFSLMSCSSSSSSTTGTVSQTTVSTTGSVSGTTSSSGTGSPITINLTAKSMAFDKNTITVSTGAQVTINFDNQDSGIPHNFAVYTNSSASKSIFVGETITGPKKTTYTFTAPTTPGSYFFRCDVHPTTMTGTFTVQ